MELVSCRAFCVVLWMPFLALIIVRTAPPTQGYVGREISLVITETSAMRHTCQLGFAGEITTILSCVANRVPLEELRHSYVMLLIKQNFTCSQCELKGTLAYAFSLSY
jgi:hypothetical protein